MCLRTSDATYGNRGSDLGDGGYSLPPELAAALRKPPIVYPEGRVPVAVLKACVNGGLDPKVIKQENGTVALQDVLRYLDAEARSSRMAEGGVCSKVETCRVETVFCTAPARQSAP